jgi:hypothetical protein
MKIDLKKDISLPKISLPKRFSGSKPKLPSVSRASGGRAGAGPQVKVPKPVGDLYRDLRDRHLLPFVALLIVAIVAAPIVFGGKGDDEPVASTAPIAAQSGGADSAFTVVPAESTLRSPAQRLGHRQALDPFRQAPTPSPESTVESNAGASEGGVISSAESSVPTEEATAPVEVTPVETPTPEETAVTESSTTTTESTEVVAAPLVVGYAVNLKTGFDPTKLQEQSEVAALTKLPSPKNPELLYVGLSANKKGALFLMTSQVTAYFGSARCTLDKQACELVELKPGKSATFEIGYGKTPTRYKVLLKGIEPVVAGKKKASSSKTTKTKTHQAKPKARSSAVGMARRFSK